MHYPKYTALHMAALQNELEDVKQLCKPENVNNTADDRQYITALHCAALSDGNIEIKKQIIACLLSNGGNINATDRRGDSALFIAAVEGKQEIVEFLIRKGAKIDKDLLKSSTASLEKRYPTILKLLQSPDLVTKQSSYEWSITKQTSTNDISSATQRKLHYQNNIEMLTLK